MDDFLRFFDDIKRRFPMHLEILYNKTCDWSIYIYKKNCASDYPKSEHYENDAVIAYCNNCDMELCFAMAHVALKEWLIENNGGY